MTSLTPTDTLTSPRPPARPYAPSWLERLLAGVLRLPAPPGAIFLGLALGLLLLLSLVKWNDGAYPAGTVFLNHAVLAGVVALIFFVTHLTDLIGVAALRDMRPALIVDQAEFEALSYQLITAPARGAFLTSLGGLAALGLWILSERGSDVFQNLKLFTSPLASLLDSLLLAFVFASIGVAVYGFVHMLRLMNHIYTAYTRIDLFYPDPLYGFSRITAFLGLSVIFAQYAWLLTSPSVMNQPLGQALAVGVPLVAGIIFLVPLLGIHGKLVDEKAHRQAELSVCVDDTITKLHRAVRDGKDADMERLTKVLQSLNLAEQRLDRIPTWPWRPETPRLMATALLLPSILWFIQRFLGRFVGS